MAIKTEVWARDIKEQLFPENSFMNQAINDDAWVDNKTVHLPQAGALPTIERNRSTLPATAVQRTDTDATYGLDEFTSTPNVIRDIEEVETSYDKRSSLVSSHSKELNKNVANWMAYHWGPTLLASMIRTDGSNVVANIPGATGNRKAMTIDNIIAARALLDDQDVPMAGRNILMPAHMYTNLLITQWKELVSLDKSGRARLADGNIMELFGFKIFSRGKNNVLSYSNAGTPVIRAPDAAPLVTANAAALVWQKDFVRRALGGVKVYAEYDNPAWYGSIFSALVRAGGRKAYSAGTGVVAIVEAAGA